MPRSDEAQAFFFMVYRAVQEVPEGKVTSYGHIAKLIGLRESCLLPIPPSTSHIADEQAAQRPRQVGVCLKHLPDEGVFSSTTVPWQRIINSKGIVSPRYV